MPSKKAFTNQGQIKRMKMRIQNYKKCYRFLDSYFKNRKIQYAIGIKKSLFYSGIIRLSDIRTILKLK